MTEAPKALGFTRSKPGHLPPLRAAAGVPTLAPGDIGVVYDHKPSLVHELIHARNRRIAGATEWSNLTHLFCVTSAEGDIIEELGGGPEIHNVSKYRGQDFWIIHVDATPAQRALCVKRWLAQLGTKYDRMAYVSEGMLCFGWPISLRSISDRNVFDCSALGCYGLLASVVDFHRPFDVMTPADVAMDYRLPLDSPPLPLTRTGRMLDLVVVAGRLIGRAFR
jgi:hypothetical protein